MAELRQSAVTPSSGASFDVLGLSAVEERMYLELVRRGSETIRSAAEALGLPEDEAARVFAALEDKGMISRTAGPDPRMRPTPPAHAVSVLTMEVEQRLQRARIAASTLDSEWKLRHHEAAVDDLVELVSGVDSLTRRVESLARQVEREFMGFVAAPVYLAGPANVDLTLEMLSRGVRTRAIYERAVFDAPGAPETIRRCAEAGEEARVIDRLPSKLLIIDGRTALLPVELGEVDAPPSAAILHSPLADNLVALSEELWRRAVPLSGAADAAESDEVAADDRRLLELLVAGLSDDAIARQLGISRRTLHRRLRHLMDLTSTDSRVQLVWRATARGWLPT
jgi:DNA-binding CsgD family transcriptional regulator